MTMALSGYAEWFWLMCKNIKDVENRNWRLPWKPRDLPVRIYLHGSKTPAPKGDIAFIKAHLTPAQLVEFDAVDWSRYRGHLMGEVTVVGEIHRGQMHKNPVSKWFFGKYGFLVQDGVLYDKPIACRGALGFFKVNLGSPARHGVE